MSSAEHPHEADVQNAVHVEPSESHEETIHQVEMPGQIVPVPSESVEEVTPPAVTSIDTIPGKTCGDTNNSSGEQQENVSDEVQNVPVQHTVASENKNKLCNQLNTESIIESGSQSGETALQPMHVTNETVDKLTPPASGNRFCNLTGDVSESVIESGALSGETALQPMHVPNETVEELTPPASGNRFCNLTEDVSESGGAICVQLNTESVVIESGAQSGETALQPMHVPNETVEKLTPPANGNRFCNLTEDVSESVGAICLQVRQSDIGSVFSAPVDIIIPKVSFLPTKSISSNPVTLAALAKKRIPKRLQKKSHVTETHKMTAVVMQLPQTKSSSSKSISAADARIGE